MWENGWRSSCLSGFFFLILFSSFFLFLRRALKCRVRCINQIRWEMVSFFFVFFSAKTNRQHKALDCYLTSKYCFFFFFSSHISFFFLLYVNVYCFQNTLIGLHYLCSHINVHIWTRMNYRFFRLHFFFFFITDLWRRFVAWFNAISCFFLLFVVLCFLRLFLCFFFSLSCTSRCTLSSFPAFSSWRSDDSQSPARPLRHQ